MTFVHEGWMGHSSNTADAILRQLLADEATTPAAFECDEKNALALQYCKLTNNRHMQI